MAEQEKGACEGIMEEGGSEEEGVAREKEDKQEKQGGEQWIFFLGLYVCKQKSKTVMKALRHVYMDTKLNSIYIHI